MDNNVTLLQAEGQMSVGGKTYDVDACVKLPSGQLIPVVNIPLMSDEKWHALARKRAQA